MFRIVTLAVLAAALSVFVTGCHDDEGDTPPRPPSYETIGLTYENPVEIEVDPVGQRALLLHDRTASSGPAIQLVDIAGRSVVETRILDYYDVYDLSFISGTSACFAGRPQGNVGYAVEFITLTGLQTERRVMITDTVGLHGYITVDTVGGFVYYSHAGGGERDGVYRIRISDKTIVDADNDGIAPYGFDNALVSGLFHRPGRVFFDGPSEKIVVSNLDSDWITFVDVSLWGSLDRNAGHAFPVNGTEHLSTSSTGLNGVRADAMAYGAGVYVFAGTASNSAYLSRFGTSSNGLDFLATMAGRTWRYRNANLCIHAREDIFSVFILQEDSIGIGIGQYRLNNLQPVSGSPYRPRVIPEESLCAMGIDTLHDRLIAGDAEHARLELISIR